MFLLEVHVDISLRASLLFHLGLAVALGKDVNEQIVAPCEGELVLQKEVHLIVVVVDIVLAKIEIAVDNFSLEDLVAPQQVQLVRLEIRLEDIVGEEDTVAVKKLSEGLLLHTDEVSKAFAENLDLLLAHIVQE